MELTKEKIETNFNKFIETGLKYEAFNMELIEALGEELVEAPCTTSTKFYGAYPGGLVNHLLNMGKYAVLVNNTLPESKQMTIKDIIRVVLIHQIGKATMFTPQTNDWFIKNKGETYMFKEGVLSLKTGERSAYLALKHGINLTEDEVFAIHNQDIEITHREMNTKGEILAAILKTANTLTILNEKQL